MFGAKMWSVTAPTSSSLVMPWLGARKLSIVRRFYEAALKHGLVRHNPARRVRGGKELTPPEEKSRL